MVNNSDLIQASASIGAVCYIRKKFEDKEKCMGENEEKLVVIKSETDSDEEFFDIENKEVKKEVKKEIPVESEMASENKGFALQVFDGTHYDKWKYIIEIILRIQRMQ